MDVLRRQITFYITAALVVALAVPVFLYWQIAIMRTLVSLWQEAQANAETWRKAWVENSTLLRNRR